MYIDATAIYSSVVVDNNLRLYCSSVIINNNLRFLFLTVSGFVNSAVRNTMSSKKWAARWDKLQCDKELEVS